MFSSSCGTLSPFIKSAPLTNVAMFASMSVTSVEVPDPTLIPVSIDTGISVGSGTSTDVTDIDANIATFVSGADLINGDSVPQDDENNGGVALGSGHGSHVAGLIASEKNNASIIFFTSY